MTPEHKAAIALYKLAHNSPYSTLEALFVWRQAPRVRSTSSSSRPLCRACVAWLPSVED
ncbi:hypothetical protein CHLRE_01g028713v5 [Chlamydomonas reinhardtii]|uniref:Uncharacterized protein n=1 Tax=Chlamydomonas reinhardtii TaxID=3055 RepID=A0A2K3E6K2_CHLRE|nr:uncharacterized protein CHLRE_01g028713v5 [Chlamydomonas reinhardtii]PNW88422.1 hypothetical protein CHLRE_01g028713v5 [Chlamydomonas reinhardtii]